MCSARSTARLGPSATFAHARSLSRRPASVRPARLPRLSLGEVGQGCELMKAGEALASSSNWGEPREHRRPGRADRRGLGLCEAERRSRQPRPRSARELDRRRRIERARPCLSRAHARAGLRGADEQEYEPVWPPTLMMNKATAVDDRHGTLTWGAAQPESPRGSSTRWPTGCSSRPATCCASHCVGGSRSRGRDRPSDREPGSGARGRRHLRERPETEPGGAARRRRDTNTSPFLSRHLMHIAGLEARRYIYPLDPPFRAAWTTVPRERQEEATVVSSPPTRA